MKKILTYNVNGIRAALNKGLQDYLLSENADIVCFQELKAIEEQIEPGQIEKLNYHKYYFSAEKRGYSGVAVFSREEPKHVEYGCGHELFDAEGRVLRLDFENYSVMSVYFPSGSSGEDRQAIKYVFLDFFLPYIQELKKKFPRLIICGDYNICHREIDIHNPKSNANSSGFLPEERAWMDQWFQSGMIDTFRAIQGDKKDQYTWWSFRANARGNNKGWRIDYISITEPLLAQLREAEIQPEAKHSDHCPSYVMMDL